MEKLRRSLDFHGRATRLDYWRFQRLMVVVSGADILLTLIAIKAIGRLGGIVLTPMLIVALASVAMSVRRLHDRNRTGWWIMPFLFLPGALWELGDRLPYPAKGGVTLAMLIVYGAGYGFVIWGWLELGFLRGTKGLNRYGQDASTPMSQVFA